MLKAAGNAIAMEKAVKKLLFENRIQSLSCEKASRPCIRIPFFQLSSLAVIKKSSSQTASKHRDSMKAIQHAHSFSMQSYETRKELADMKKEFAALQKQHNRLQSKMKALEDQAESATQAKQEADEKAEAAEAIKNVAEAEKKEALAKAAQAEKELEVALATKEADIKAADEEAYNQGMADVTDAYEKQVKEAYNKGVSFGWMSLVKKLDLPADSPWRKAEAIPMPFPPPAQAEEEAESEAEVEEEAAEDDEALVRKPKDATGAKSLTQGDQILDLTQEEDGLVAEETAPEQTPSDVPPTEKHLDETVAEIDAEVAADKEAEVVVEKEAEAVLQEPSEVPVPPPVNAEET